MYTMKQIADHIAFLEGTLIPDLRESGSDATADDFQTTLDMLRQMIRENNDHKFGTQRFTNFMYENRTSDGYHTGPLEIAFADPVTEDHAKKYLTHRANVGGSTLEWVTPKQHITQ